MNTKQETGADKRTYVAERFGSGWAIWCKRPGKFPAIVSKHRTESAAHNALIRWNRVQP